MPSSRTTESLEIELFTLAQYWPEVKGTGVTQIDQISVIHQRGIDPF